MFFYLFLLFTIVPLVELALLVWLGTETVWWLPILLVIADGLLGALLWRSQGFKVISRIQTDMAAGRMPEGALVDGLLIFLAGALLITPGMLTDVVALALLIPPIRTAVKRLAKAWFIRHVEVRTASFKSTTSRGCNTSQTSTNGDKIIDAQVVSTHVEDAV